MTRKCALCRESNYKNVYSFFSAPKNQIMRKCWENALSMEVTDDTFICSKHFHQEDIITHWVSGQPPHVITIKYKKCRLKPTAVPIIGIEFENNIQKYLNEQEDSYELKVNRNQSTELQDYVGQEEGNTMNLKYELSYSQGRKKTQSKEKDQISQVFINCDKNVAENTNSVNIDVKKEQELLLIPQDDVNEFIYENSSDCNNDIKDYILKNEGNNLQAIKSRDYSENIKKKMKTEENKLITTSTNFRSFLIEDNYFSDSQLLNKENENQTVEIWETSVVEEIKNDQFQTVQTLPNGNCQSEYMLFEDLLEISSEAALPKGWTSNVIPKGHDTTIMFLFTSMKNSSIPFIEKQVYIKSDMILHFGTSNCEIDPFKHKLIRDGRDSRIKAITDLEDAIEEFDQRRICQGINETIFEKNKNLSLTAVKEGSKWRHLECIIFIYNGKLSCQKCVSLTDYSDEMKNTEQNMFKKMSNITNYTDANSENTSEFTLNPSSNTNNMTTVIDSLKIPEIQKIMMKECLKTSTELDGKKSIKFSKTWIFLCVLLYIESPRMYRYMLLNNYLTLPPLFTIQRYLHRIKTEPRFYKFFQKSIEPFQPIEKGESVIKMEA